MILQRLEMPDRVPKAHKPLQAGYGVSCSSFRVNLGSAYTPLFVAEDNRIKAALKVYNGTVEQDEEATYPPSMNRPDYGRGFYFCSVCGISWMGIGKCPNCRVKLREKSRKKKVNNVCS
jgi:rubrerythrin